MNARMQFDGLNVKYLKIPTNFAVYLSSMVKNDSHASSEQVFLAEVVIDLARERDALLEKLNSKNK